MTAPPALKAASAPAPKLKNSAPQDPLRLAPFAHGLASLMKRPFAGLSEVVRIALACGFRNRFAPTSLRSLALEVHCGYIPAACRTPCYCAALRAATRKTTALYDEALAPVGIGVAQFSLMRRIKSGGRSR